MKKKAKYLFILLLIALAGCSSRIRPPRDLQIYSQNPSSYVGLEKGDSLIVSRSKQLEIDSLSLIKYYNCWDDSLTTDTLSTTKLLSYYLEKLESLEQYPGIGENKLMRDSSFAIELRKRSNLDQGFNRFRKGIMLKKANIRVLPTNKPYYLDFAKAGEGYPFDYWQNSTIPMGTPIFIYHEIDNWVLISCHLCSGWVEKDNIAYINNEIISQLKKENRIAITHDRSPIYSKKGEYLGSADIGTFFPYLFSDEVNHKATFVKRNDYGFAELLVINIARDNAEKMPIALTENNIARLASRLMNQNYGWGGMYYNRDCSQMTLDLMTPFGLILPRNGNHQAEKGGVFLSADTINVSDYNDFIISNSQPFTTLVRIPGHIMLYVGEENGHALVMHNIWGLKTKSFWGNEGRYIIGKTVISSLELGKDLKNIDKNRLMLNRLSGIVQLFK